MKLQKETSEQMKCITISFILLYTRQKFHFCKHYRQHQTILHNIMFHRIEYVVASLGNHTLIIVTMHSQFVPIVYEIVLLCLPTVYHDTNVLNGCHLTMVLTITHNLAPNTIALELTKLLYPILCLTEHKRKLITTQQAVLIHSS